MTGDIVERLRDSLMQGRCGALMDISEAADEIEHLRHEIADYQRIVRTAEPGDNRISAAELERIAQADEIEWLRAVVNRVIEDLEAVVFCDGHTRAMPCEPECHCVQHYDAVRELIR
jgi:HAMP domain-containing protein